MDNGELEAIGCKTFACSSLNLIDEKGKELGLRDSTIKRAKDMASEYLKKTYHRPRYSSVIYLLPSFVHIASILEEDPILKSKIMNVFGSSGPTITKWDKDIIDTLNIQITESSSRSKPIVTGISAEFVYYNPNFEILDKKGKMIGLRDDTIAKAKELGLRYFEKTYKIYPYNNGVDHVFPALLYIATIIKNDKRISQEIIAKIFHTRGHSIDGLISDIIKVLGMKMTRNNCYHIESISE